MRNLSRFLMLLLTGLLLFPASGAFSQAGEPVVVASTSWTAAFAAAAGARDIRIIAPMELKHPPEYDLKPSDLDAVKNAALVVYAGYEKFAKKLAETAGGANLTSLRILTANAPETIKAESEKIARLIGTSSRFAEWARSFDSFAEDVKARVLSAYPDRRAVVHKMQRPFAEWLGLEIVGEYGPAEPSPALVLELVKKRPALVIDNYHNPSGFPIAEAAKSSYVQLINFPGKDGTRTFEDLYRYNGDALVSVAARR